MKVLTLVLSAISFLCFANSSAFALPTLNKIQVASFSAPYSCKGDYTKSALFLSSESLSPDLLFNGACGAVDYVEANTQGDDFSLISDLGDVPLQDVSASKSFNFGNVVGGDNTFKETAPIVLGHTYSVLVSHSNVRSLFAFKVISFTPDKSMTINYAVKSYTFNFSGQVAPGFSWDAGNK